MTKDYEIKTYDFEWQGIGITLTYAPDWLGMHASHGHDAMSHIEVRSADKQPLPITETGYKSHFFAAREIDPISEVQEWLDREAGSKEWKRYIVESQQLSLF